MKYHSFKSGSSQISSLVRTWYRKLYFLTFTTVIYTKSFSSLPHSPAGSLFKMTKCSKSRLGIIRDIFARRFWTWTRRDWDALLIGWSRDRKLTSRWLWLRDIQMTIAVYNKYCWTSPDYASCHRQYNTSRRRGLAILLGAHTQRQFNTWGTFWTVIWDDSFRFEWLRLWICMLEVECLWYRRFIWLLLKEMAKIVGVHAPLNGKMARAGVVWVISH